MDPLPLSEYLDYLKGLAKSHKSILHGHGREAFFGFDYGEFANANQKGIGKTIMIALRVSGSLFKSGDDEHVSMTGGFMIACAEEKHQDFQQQYDAYGRALKIGMEIIAKVLEDSFSGNCPRFMRPLKAEDVRYEQTEMIGDRYVGWYFTFPIKSLNALEHNPEVWR